MRLLTVQVWWPSTGFMMKVNLEDVDEWVSKGWTRDEPAKRMTREVAPDLGVAPAAEVAPPAPSKPPKSK